MAVADAQRAGAELADEGSAGEHRLSLAEWLVLCLVREKPTYGLMLVGLLERNGSPGSAKPGCGSFTRRAPHLQ